MFFTKIGTAAAFSIIYVAFLYIFTGLLAANDPEWGAQVYSRPISSGTHIDKGIELIFVGIAFGVLTEISKPLANLVNRKEAN